MPDSRLAMATTPHSAPRIASYQADPAEVGRVLLLYSGGLDTSVMLHWIQARYGAEIVTLTVDLGQPGEDWEVVVGKAKQLGAIDAIRADAARSSRSSTSCPRSRRTRSMAAATRSSPRSRAR